MKKIVYIIWTGPSCLIGSGYFKTYSPPFVISHIISPTLFVSFSSQDHFFGSPKVTKTGRVLGLVKI